jgi:hypothetical protein
MTIALMNHEGRKTTRRVSVALATYNGEEFLSQQLQSIAEQRLQPYELVVTDDCSEDSTCGIVDAFAQEAPFPVRLHRNNTRLGYKSNFFRAIRLCRGDLIALSDQDDIWAPDKLVRAVEEFEADHEVTVVGHTSAVVRTDLTKTGALFPQIKRRRVHAPGRFPVWGTQPGFTTMFSRLLVELADPDARPVSLNPPVMNDPLMAHDDWVVFVGGALGKIVQIPMPLALYRRHDINTGGQFREVTVGTRLEQSLAMSQEATHYSGMASLAEQRAAYLLQIQPNQEQSSEAIETGLFRAQRAYQRTASALNRRSNLYASTRSWRRIAQLFANAGRGDYRPRSRGGHGAASLAKDAFRTAGSPTLAARVIRRFSAQVEREPH